MNKKTKNLYYQIFGTDNIYRKHKNVGSVEIKKLLKDLEYQIDNASIIKIK